MEKISTVKMKGKKILKGQLTIGLDLGDRSSCYCVLDENGEIIREQKIPTTPEGMQQAFGKMARSRIAMETGTHSPWVSRVLTELGHEVIVPHARLYRWTDDQGVVHLTNLWDEVPPQYRQQVKPPQTS